jgi:hypothetical protein
MTDPALSAEGWEGPEQAAAGSLQSAHPPSQGPAGDPGDPAAAGSGSTDSALAGAAPGFGIWAPVASTGASAGGHSAAGVPVLGFSRRAPEA